MKKADGFRNVSAKAREEYAATVLDVGKLLADASTSAALGEQSHAFVFDRPIDLPQTDAAKALKVTLAQLGFAMEWQKRTLMTGVMEKTAWALILRW